MQSGRLFRLLYLLLEGENWTVRRLSERLEASERTIRRDLDALSAAGIPVYTVQGRGGGVRLLPGFVLDRSLLSGQEQDTILYGLQTLHATGMDATDDLLRELSRLFRRETAKRWIDADFSPWNGGIDRALFDLLREAILHHIPILLRELSRLFRRETAKRWIDADFSPWNGGIDRALFDLLREAILHHIPISFDYYSAEGEATSRTIEPVRLSFKGMAWYIQGWCRLREDFRTFKLNRMDAVSLCEGEHFTPRELPPLPDQIALGTNMTSVVVRFAPEIAYRVYDEFDRARIAPQPDGSLIVHTDWPPGLWGAPGLHPSPTAR